MQGMPGWMKWAISLLVGVAIILVGFRWAGWLLTSFFVMNCFVLIIVVLLQSGKAADLGGAFGGAGSQTAFGPRGAATLLSRATSWCAVMFMICAMALVLRVDRADQGGSILQKFSKPAPATKPVPVKPTPAAPATRPAPQSTTPQSTTPQSSAPQSGTTPAPTQPAQSAPATTPTQPKKQ